MAGAADRDRVSSFGWALAYIGGGLLLAADFGFHEISDSGTSWLGPLIFGLAYQLSGSCRSALVSLVAFFVLGFVLLVRVPLRPAIEQAGNVAPKRVRTVRARVGE